MKKKWSGVLILEMPFQTLPSEISAVTRFTSIHAGKRGFLGVPCGLRVRDQFFSDPVLTRFPMTLRYVSEHLPNADKIAMSRPSHIEEQRKRLLPIVCEVFSELGYHRTTTAELADRCGVRENTLYRLWQDKKAMFLAAVEDIFQSRAKKWGKILAKRPTPQEAADALVAYEAKHQGEFGFYRVVFTALVEADDPEIREAITGMYRRFHELIRKLTVATREGANKSPELSADATAWAMIGLATASNIVRELELVRPRQRKEMFVATAKYLLREGST